MSKLLQSLTRQILLVLFASAFSFFFMHGQRNLNQIFLRTLRREPALTQFETAQIANLCPADSEEAKSVIPRYAKKRKFIK